MKLPEDPDSRVDSLPLSALDFIKMALRGRLAFLYALGLLLMCGSQQLDSLVPVGMKGLVNAADSLRHGAGTSGRLWVRFAVLCAFFAGAVLLARSYQATDSVIGPAVRRRIQEIVTSYILSRPPVWFDRIPSGTLGQYAAALPASVAVVLEIFCVDLARVTVLAVSSTIIVATLNGPLAAGICLWVSLYVLYSLHAAGKARKLAAAAGALSASTAGELMDVFSNARTIWDFSGGAFERRRLKSVFGQEHAALAALRIYTARVRLMQSLLVLACILMINGVVGWRFSLGRLTVGDLSMAFGISTFLCVGVWQSSTRLVDLSEHTGRIGDILAGLNRSAEPPIALVAAQPPAIVRGDVGLQCLSFGYPDSAELFRNFTLEIPAGQRLGIAGPSGAGKSTLFRLLRRHLRPEAGTISIDGVDIGRLDTETLNSLITEVVQTPVLFNRSIAENVAYGRHDAPFEEVVEACVQAQCQEFILRRSEGYGFQAGEGGRNLSAGERQRLVIARALLRNSPIVLLDEPTSALDAESETMVNRALTALFRLRTVIVIAHRMWTLQNMDRIIYIDRGRIVESGTHDELLQLGGAYAKACSLQTYRTHGLSIP